MDIAKTINEIQLFASIPKAFKFDELLNFTDENIDTKTFRRALLNRSRFLCLHSDSQEEDRFILDSMLFQWYTRLNLKLAKIKQFHLTEHQLVSVMNHLRGDGRWDSPPSEAIRWGEFLGLICRSYSKNHFIFPYVRILTSIKPRNVAIVTNLLKDLSEKHIWALSLKKLTKESLSKGFSKFSKQISNIVQCREALKTGKKITLQELGDYYNLTRERIRQLEDKFWTTLHFRYSYRTPFLSAFLYNLMDNSGSRIVDINSQKAQLRIFLAKCADIPQLSFPNIGLVILATTKRDMSSLRALGSFPDGINPDFLSDRLESNKNLSLSGNDIKKLAKKVVDFRLRRLQRDQRVFLALKTIGKPAHYSKVTNVYGSLWPEFPMSEHSVHAALTNKKYGVVWIGIKGTYALREWGYERPTKTIFETVKEIVQRRYEETGVPVPVSVIIAEIGKHRKVINPSSIAIAIHCNPELKRTSKNNFIPNKSENQTQDELSLNELDNILKEFREKARVR